MTSRPSALASATLGLSLLALAPRLPAAEASHLDFAAAKAKAAESGKLVLVDFSAPN